MPCNNYLAAASCPECGSITRFIEAGGVVCNNCGAEAEESLAQLTHGGRFCTCKVQP